MTVEEEIKMLGDIGTRLEDRLKRIDERLKVLRKEWPSKVYRLNVSLQHFHKSLIYEGINDTYDDASYCYDNK